MSISTTASVVVGLAVWLFITYTTRLFLFSKKNNLPPLPPGPKGLPLVGNLTDLPNTGDFESNHWLKHKKLYGPISSITILGQSIIVLNDAELALELFEKRSSKYSGRPKQIFAGEMVGYNNVLGFIPYDSRWRTMRKNMSRVLGSTIAVGQFNDLQQTEVAHFLLHLLGSPDKLGEHIRKEVGTIVLKISYGYNAEPHKEDVLINMAETAMDKFGRAAVPLTFMVDIFPFLRFLPEWMPGASFKRTARQWAAELQELTEKPYAFVKQQMAQGSHAPSLMSRLIENGEEDPHLRDDNKYAAITLFLTGADTSSAAIATFFLAMSMYPEVQKLAQEEIDQVIGKDRLPTLADRPYLPYINAVVKETMRWHPVAPMGLPHLNDEDDICNGYMIPKGSLLIANIWHFTHDSDSYHEPDAFKPERFIGAEGRQPETDPSRYVFGFGRRICPGRILADNTLFLTVVQALAAFKIDLHEGDRGKKITPTFTPGVVSFPSPYKCEIKPRSSHHADMIKSLEQIHPWQQSDGDTLASMKMSS